MCRKCASTSQRAGWIDGAIAAYRSGKTLAEVGKLFGRTEEGVRKVLKRANVPRMSASERRVKLHRLTFVEQRQLRRQWKANYRAQQRFLLRCRVERMYCSGLIMQKIADKLGLRYAVAVHRLLSPAIEHRKRGVYDRSKTRKKWDRLLDGHEHIVTQSLANLAYVRANRRGKGVKTRRLADGKAVVQAYETEETKPFDS